MTDKETKLIKKITTEYLGFLKESKKILNDTKRATSLAIKEVLKLKDDDSILIKDDGSVEIIPARTGEED